MKNQRLKPTKPKVPYQITNHRSFKCPTSDDWYPNFPRETVQIRLSEIKDSNQITFIISVWGADDCGMEKIISVPKSIRHETLMNLFDFVDNKLPNPLTKNWLKSQGFVSA